MKTSILIICIASLCLQYHAEASTNAGFVDASNLRPQMMLILPQSFKVPTNPLQEPGDENLKLKQFVALVSTVQNERDDQLIRQQFKRLSLQVRDARSPVTGQLFFEHTFDYFPAPPQRQHLLIALDLEQVSPSGGEQVGAQHLVVSVRPASESGIDAGAFGSETLEFVSSAPIPIEWVASSDGRRSFAVVQTDKPIYKPEDKVRIRALVVNENLRPVGGDELRLQVRNPQRVVVEEIRFPRNDSSLTSPSKKEQQQFFLDHQFEFPPEPMLGTWSLHLLHADPIANDSTSFELKEYVLPTYEIEFESPKYILPTTQSISGSIVAKYHYGRPVQGKAHLKFGYKTSAQARPIFLARSTIKDIDPVTGRADYRLTSDKFREIAWFPKIAGSRLYVEATVTEMATGHREVSQDASCLFISQPYKFNFDHSIEDFKPGLTQSLSVQLLDAQSRRPAPAGALIRAEYKDQNDTQLLPVTMDKLKLQMESRTDADGWAHFQVGPIDRPEVAAIQVTLRWLNDSERRSVVSDQSSPSYNELALGFHTLNRHQSPNGWIAFMNKSAASQLAVGDTFVSDLLIRDALVMPHKIYYAIVARGQIIGLDGLQPDGLVRFQVTEQMVPSVRLVLFALTPDSNGLLSDSMRLEVRQSPVGGCGLNLSYKSLTEQTNNNEVRPNNRGLLTVRGRPGDWVSLIGVDEAVYTLNNRSRLETSRILDRIRRLDTGCGFGGGRNNLDVFHNAGLMLFRRVHDQQPDELQLGTSCMTMHAQLRHLQDLQLGYSRPMFQAAAQLNRPRSAELAQTVRHLMTSGGGSSKRRKRESELETMMRRFKEPEGRACCRLGSLEDSPQRRNCSVRARIVDRYMRQAGDAAGSRCSQIYLECCRLMFDAHDQHLNYNSIFKGRSELEPQVTSRVLKPVEMRQEENNINSNNNIMNIGHLDRIERETLTRRDFRETWLFEVVKVGDEREETQLEVQLPHSMTGWAVSALALNRRRPMCLLAQPLRLATFQEVFLQVSMPYKVVQGEQIDLVATVFNYWSRPLEVIVYMWGVEDLCSEAEAGERSERRRLSLAAHSSQSLIFPMIPLKTGSFPIKLVAITTATGLSDAIERRLLVVARGRPVADETTFSLDPMNQQRRSKRAIQTGNLVDEIDSSKGLQRSRVRLVPTRDPELIVPGTHECLVSAIGDRMGQVAQTALLDVENLLRLPHGCGEQVMIYLAPTLYTATYLQAQNRLTGELRWRALRYIQAGYKRVLNFRKEGGSFSAFAKRDPSIWLTAFVVKLLCQVERTSFVRDEVHVDRTVVNSALDWLIRQQDETTGAWLEPNPVYHREMLGGVLKERALTAFVVISLNECHHHGPDLVADEDDGGADRLGAATRRAEQSLALDRQRAQVQRNPYALALVAYALSFSRPRDAATALGELLHLAERSHARNQLYWRGDHAVETAAYALQALVELAPILKGPIVGSSPSSDRQASGGKPTGNWQAQADALAISNWLASRRSFSGAFESTQDTVVALEALAKFSKLQVANSGGNQLTSAGPDADQPLLTCNLTLGGSNGNSSSQQRAKRSMEFGRHNAQILQTYRLEPGAFEIGSVAYGGEAANATSGQETIDITTSGTGLGTMSVRLKYNVFQEQQDETCKFVIDSSIDEWQPTKLVVSDDQQQPGQTDPSGQQKVAIAANGSQSHQQHPELEDDYFKKFDEGMLNELNLVRTTAPTTRRGNDESGYLLRLKRSTAVDSSTEANFAARLAASLLPAKWFQADNHQAARNTSRRSAHPTQVPLVVLPAPIPPDAKLNNLSQTLDFNSLDANKTTATTTTMTNNNTANRLKLLLKVCVHHLSSRRDSEMGVIEVGIISGFKPYEPDLKEILEEPGTPAMKYELSPDRSLVIIYMQYIPASGQFCLQFRMVRDSLVYNLQPGYIRVYEYYAPAHSCASFYTPTRLSDLIETKCDSAGQVCQCAARSLCPRTSRLTDLAEIHAANVTQARQQLMELVCSPDRYTFVALVRLKSVRHVEAAKQLRVLVRPKSDLRGNLTRVLELARRDYQQRHRDNMEVVSPSEDAQPAEDAPELLELVLDTSCAHQDPLLLHLAHPAQWGQGGQLMILFGRHSRLERRPLAAAARTTATTAHLKQSRRLLAVASANSLQQPISHYPRPKPNVISPDGLTDGPDKLQEALQLAQVAPTTAAHLQQMDSGQPQQYSLALDKEAILHDLAYQAKVGPRATINSLVSWLELRARREKWACPS